MLKKVMEIQEYVTGYEMFRGEDGVYHQTDLREGRTKVHALVSEDLINYFIDKAVETNINRLGDDYYYSYDKMDQSLLLMNTDDESVTKVLKYTYLVTDTELTV